MGLPRAFERATDAARAALEIQAAITDEPWPDPLGPLRVRMGLHTGEAEVRDESYYGSAVNRAARVMAIAWGGQVVCTASTASLLVDDLELCDLGEHRLRDLSRPERVWQLGVDEFSAVAFGFDLAGEPADAGDGVRRSRGRAATCPRGGRIGADCHADGGWRRGKDPVGAPVRGGGAAAVSAMARGCVSSHR